MRVPKLCQHASGQSVVRILGKDYYCGKHGEPATVRKYELLIAEFISNKHSFGKNKRKNTIGSICLSYIEFSESHYKSKSEINNIKLVITCLVSLYEFKNADDFGPTEFKTLRSQFSKEGKSRSRQFVNKCMRLIVRMLSWATGEEMIDSKVIAAVREVASLKKGKTSAPESKKVHAVTREDIDLALPEMFKIIADMVKLQLLLGCRPGELCAMTGAMVDKSKPIWEIDFEHHKNEHRDQTRVVYVGPKAQAILQRYLDQRGEGVLFRSRSSKGYCTGSYGRAIRRACERAKVTPWSPNQLRHKAANEIRDSHDLEHVAAVLGHADVETSKIYAKIRRDQAIAVASNR
jgi:integrase